MHFRGYTYIYILYYLPAYIIKKVQGQDVIHELISLFVYIEVRNPASDHKYTKSYWTDGTLEGYWEVLAFRVKAAVCTGLVPYI